MDRNYTTEPLFTTERMDIYVQNPLFLDEVISYYRENASFLAPWEPAREEPYFSRQAFLERLKSAEAGFSAGASVQLAAFDKVEGDLVGICNFTGIIRGPFQACFLGYSLARCREGKGYMFEILTPSIAYMFQTMNLHRIMANYMPRNERSGRLLERLGFEREGLARAYLQINGRWEDHVLTSLINDSLSP